MSSSAALADWFARRTFAATELDLDALVAAKRDRDTTVSLVLPARNEAATITDVVASGVALQGRLVDEVVVLDGASTDGTAELAASAGAVVHQDADIVPDVGPTLGKGDALWRSLRVTSGDIVAFVDTDIRNPDPRFVWGIVAPLLLDARINLVKAFYDRPIEAGGSLQTSGGGRVTELMARPLLNLFWPALAGLVQPLSGEYAGRRAVLEQVPFFTGYGVEIGLLIDILALRGADAIAQVDVGRRVHRNQELHDLSRMAYAIATVALGRLAAEQRATFAQAFDPRYVQFGRDSEGRITLEPADVADVERPPMASLPR
ncbi:MAG TPA: glucosyl-3-phosphoglycerate synthase [Euzebyales bacterium]|nr:glucosyl-3-phosphoglycerate synthase [Euzebyales bacterium]